MNTTISNLQPSNNIWGGASTVYDPYFKGIQLPYPQDTWSYCIRKVANGFVLKKDGEEFVFESLESLCKKLKEFEEKEINK